MQVNKKRTLKKNELKNYFGPMRRKKRYGEVICIYVYKKKGCTKTDPKSTMTSKEKVYFYLLFLELWGGTKNGR